MMDELISKYINEAESKLELSVKYSEIVNKLIITLIITRQALRSIDDLTRKNPEGSRLMIQTIVTKTLAELNEIHGVKEREGK